MEEEPDDVDKSPSNLLIAVAIASTSVTLVLIQGGPAIALLFICLLLSLLKLLRRITKQNGTIHKTSSPFRLFLHKVLVPTIQAILLIPVAFLLLVLAIALIFAAKIYCDPYLGFVVLILIPLSATWFVLGIAKDKNEDKSTVALVIEAAQESGNSAKNN